MILTINGERRDVTYPSNPLYRAVLISLFTWRRAEPDDSPELDNGWWGDSFPTFQNDRIGSRLYLLSREKLTNKTPLKAREYIRQALQWLVDDGVAVSIEVSVTRSGIETLQASVVINQREGNRLALTFDDLWSDLNG
ncbi:phage GP46 family protein [Siccibacter turicensis]|uniref:phage GP46 family protein n=1 Tax=Siccibacter turicensis TaxID=357233 RepID=UPI0023F48E56|nr:phage GP46 family protein [Siccibacter turicensis]